MADTTNRKLDPEKIREAYAAGKTPTQLAEEFSCARSSIAYHLKQPGQAGSEASAARAEGNGHAAQVEMAAPSELEKLLNDFWQRLPVIERVRLLLDHRARPSVPPSAAPD